jgi:polyphosphate kinase
VLKTNGLTDPATIDALYRASQAGVEVDLIVRGRCCLRPGVPGLSERISVRSIVGRYLEHSRLFRFGGVGDRPLEVWIGSADLMERNLERRVEVVVPIEDPEIQSRVAGMLDLALADEANSWMLQADGNWTRVAPNRGPGTLGFNLQDHFQTQALASRRHRRDSALHATPAVRAAREPDPSMAEAAPSRDRRRWSLRRR